MTEIGGVLMTANSYNLPEPINLQGADTAHPTFIAPYVSNNVMVTFVLEVNDGTDYSAPDMVNVVIQQTNNPPIADAGDDRTAKAGSSVTLGGLHSYDPDGNPIVSYRWTQVEGPPVVLSTSNEVPEPNFMVPTEIGAKLVFKLQVSDGMESSKPSPGADSSQPDTVAYTVVANNPPIAKAGDVQTVNEGSLVVLDRTRSYDPDTGDHLSYFWEQVAGQSVLLDDPASPRPTFVAPFLQNFGAGESLNFKLTVRDNDPGDPLKSEPAYACVYVRNSNVPPTCALAKASEEILWPPDHKMRHVEIIGIRDQGTPSDTLTTRITAVTLDEPINGTGDGDSGPDAFIMKGENADSVMLRAERQGTGNGRVYRIHFTASDGYESCVGSVVVSMPQHRMEKAVDDGEHFDATRE